MKLTGNQRAILRRLILWGRADFYPSSHFAIYLACRTQPGPILKRLAARGLVECNGYNSPGEGLCYRITQAGIDALEAGR
jgi:hypothetical protein